MLNGDAVIQEKRECDELVHSLDGTGIAISLKQLSKAFSALKNSKKLDAVGVCCEILWLFTLWQPKLAVAFFETLVSSNKWAKELAVSGHCVAKS